MEQRYLSIKDACEYTGMGEDSLLRMLKDAGKCVYQRSEYGLRTVDKKDIDDAFMHGKRKYNYLKEA